MHPNVVYEIKNDNFDASYCREPLGAFMIISVGRKADELAKWTAVLLGFSLPISTALDSLLLALMVVLWLLGNNFREKYTIIGKNPVALAALVMCGIYVLGLFYGQVDKGALSDAKTFLLIPLMITLFQEERIRRYAWWGFLASMLLTLLLSYLIFFHFLPNYLGIKMGPIRPGTVQSSIAQNFFMAFTAFFLAIKARFADRLFLKLVFGACSLLATINVLFIVPSKTGQLVLVLLIGYYLFDWLHWKGVIVASLMIVFVAGIIYRMPTNAVHVRLSELIQEYGQWQPNRAADIGSATGMRMEFYYNSLKIIRANPLFGVGTGGFRTAYQNQIKNSQMAATHNPHNQYLLTGVELGLIGLIGLATLFIIQWRMTVRLPHRPERMLAYAMLLAMITGCMFNSFLADHAEGLFYVWTTAVLFAGLSSSYRVDAGS
jgi:O-antigen ligase